MIRHIEFLIEDESGKKLLEHLLPKIITDPSQTTYQIHAYRGIGKLPQGIKTAKNIRSRMLLKKLPAILNAHGKTFAKWKTHTLGCVIVVCDLDDKNQIEFQKQLQDILHKCPIPPEADFCFAIEESEAWLLGDIAAIKAAYPKAKIALLKKYKNDSICGTWEKLADAIGFSYTNKPGYTIGIAKSEWADRISEHMEIDRNLSPSFSVFVKTVRKRAGVQKR